MSVLSKNLGVCSWSLRPEHPAELVDVVRATGLNRMQFALSPMVEHEGVWGQAIEALRTAGLEVVSGMISPIGEDYSTLESIRRIGRVVPDPTWDGNRAMIDAIAKLCARYHLPIVTFHAGFIPHQAGGAASKIIELVSWVADRMSDVGTVLLLEKGQEAEEDLEASLKRCTRPHLGVNFDPANMQLYGKGEPIAALQRLRPWVRQVHIKDAIASEDPTQWGQEVAVGTGQVDWDAFLRVLHDVRFEGNQVIEREAGEQRVQDIQTAASFIIRKQGDA